MSSKIQFAILALAASAAPLFAGCTSETAGETSDTSSSESELGRRRAPVYLNHTYGMMSPATIDALQHDAYLSNEFVDVEVRTTVTPDRSWTGTYLNMRETYLEFFPVGTFGFPSGVFGLGLGVDDTGGIDALQTRWKTEFGDDQVALAPQSHEVNGVQVPWFKSLSMSWSDSSNYAAIWAMEYFPSPGSTTPRTRLQERAARYAPSKLARNVSAAVYGIETADAAFLRRTFTSAGWQVQNEGNGFVGISPLDGGVRRRLHFVITTTGRLGLLGLTIRMNRYDRRIEPLGDGILDVGAGGRKQAFLWFLTPTTPEQTALSSAEGADDAESAE